MTTGGDPDVASDGRVVPDKQGEVSTQHRPSAKSERVRIREVKYGSQTYKHIKNHLHYHHHTLLLR